MSNIAHSNICLFKGKYCYDFERFTQKTLRGVLNQYKRLTEKIGYRPIFFEPYWHADRIELKTLNERTKEFELKKTFTSNEFMSAIGWTTPPAKTDKAFFKDSLVIKELMEKGLITL